MTQLNPLQQVVADLTTFEATVQLKIGFHTNDIAGRYEALESTLKALLGEAYIEHFVLRLDMLEPTFPHIIKEKR